LVAIVATLIAAGLNILIIPIAQPGQTSNFNQSVNASDVSRGVLAFTTFAATVEYFISLTIFIVLLLDSMYVLWGLISPATLQPQMGDTLSRKSSTLVKSETAALIESGGVDLQYSSRLDWIEYNYTIINNLRQKLSVGIFQTYISAMCIFIAATLYISIFTANIVLILYLQVLFLLVHAAFVLGLAVNIDGSVVFAS